jgi:hypothetical protein
MAAVAALGEVARPEVMRAALAELIARDGESAMTHAAALVLEDLERKWSRGAEVMRTLRFDR